MITFLTPGLRFFHQGQREGKTGAHSDASGAWAGRGGRTVIAAFYDGLLACLKDEAFRDGTGGSSTPARRAGNDSNDAFIAFSWTGPGDHRRLVAVNYAGHQSQCYIALPWGDLAGR